MGVDAEKILVCLWRFLQFFMNTTHRCVEMHPFVSGILLLLFIVYVFFNFLAYFFPFIVFTVILLKYFWSSGHFTIVQDVKEAEKRNVHQKDEKRNDKISNTHYASVKEDNVVRRSIETPSFQTQKSRRRNFIDKSRLLDAEAGTKAKDLFPSSKPTDNSIGKTDLIDQNQKIDSKEKDSSLGHGQKNSAANATTAVDVKVDANHPTTYPESEVDQLEEADEDDEEETNEANDQSMEWTADDEKNLMDLGLSEIERNKRLESLIAKRRARKIFKLQVEKALSSLHGGLSHVAPILIAKNDPLIVSDHSNEIGGLQIPGSAPSVLLPTQNPFDLPYDPHEEKPNLMADSFQQEFAEAHQKEMLFCRHESFSLGPSYPFEYKQDRHDSKFKAMDGLGFSRFRRQPGEENNDQPIEQIMSKPYDRKPLVDNTPDIIENGSNYPTPMIDKEASKDEDNAKYRTEMIDIKDKTVMESAIPKESMFARSEVHEEPQVIEDGNDDSPSLSSSPTSSSSSSSSELTPNIFNPSRAGIPKPTLGYAAHSSFGLSVPRGIIHREPYYDSSLNSSPTSNPKSKMEERLLYEMKPCHTPTFSIASDMQVEVSDCGSPPAGNENNSPTDSDSLTISGEIEKSLSSDLKMVDDTRKGMKQVRDINDSHHLDPLLPDTSENSKQLPEKLEPQPADEVQLPEKTEEPLNPLDKPTEEANTNIYGKRDPAIDTIDGKEDRKEGEDKDSKAQMLIQEEIAGEKPKPAEETKSQVMGNSESFADHNQSMNYENLDHIGDRENPQTLIQQDILGELPKSTKETELESSKQIEDSSDDPADHKTIESVQPNKEGNKNVNTLEDSEEPQKWEHKKTSRELPDPAREVNFETNMHNEENSTNPDIDQSVDHIEPKEDIEDSNLTRGNSSEDLVEEEERLEDMSKTIETVMEVLTHQENAEELPDPSEETELKSNIDIEPENSADHQPVESVQQNQDNEDSSPTGNSEKLAEQEGASIDTSNPIQTEGSLLAREESRDEQSLVEREYMHTNHSSDDHPISSVVEQVTPVEEVPVNSSPSSSPTSVLTKNIAVGEMSSASLNEMVPMDVPQSDVEAMVRISSSAELPLDNEPSYPPKNIIVDTNLVGSTSEPQTDNNVGTMDRVSNDKASEGDLGTLLYPEAVAEFSIGDVETHTTPIENASRILVDFQTEIISNLSEDKEKLKSVEESEGQPDDAEVNIIGSTSEPLNGSKVGTEEQESGNKAIEGDLASKGQPDDTKVNIIGSTSEPLTDSKVDTEEQESGNKAIEGDLASQGQPDDAKVNIIGSTSEPLTDSEVGTEKQESGNKAIEGDLESQGQPDDAKVNIIGSVSEPLSDGKVGTEEPESDNKAIEGDLATLLKPEAVEQSSKEDLETHTTTENASGILEDLQKETMSKLYEDKEKVKSVEESGGQPTDAKVNMEAKKDGGEDGDRSGIGSTF